MSEKTTSQQESIELKTHYNHWPSRSLCSILEDMRTTLKINNFSYLNGLIEEIQYSANRMEAGLEDKEGLFTMKQDYSKLKKEYNTLIDMYNEITVKYNDKMEESVLEPQLK